MEEKQIKPFVKEGCILLRSGRYLDLTDPDPYLINIYDIAHALSYLCRYTGHSERFYSVAEHSLRVCHILPDHLKLEGLLHDASEAYLGDLSSPLKNLVPQYKNLEDRMNYTIRNTFNLPFSASPEVSEADLIMLGLERRKFLPSTEEQWGVLCGLESQIDRLEHAFNPQFISPEDTELEFLREFFRITDTNS